MDAKEFLKQKNIKPIRKLINGELTGEFILTIELMNEFENMIKKKLYDKSDMEYAYNADREWQSFEKFIDEYDAPL